MNIDEVTVAPTVQSRYGRAWRIDLVSYRKIRRVDPAEDPTKGIWVVELPSAHPAWHSYMLVLSGVDRRYNGQLPTIHFANATHEIVVFAMNPDKSRQAMLEGKISPADCVLTPCNFASQFIATNQDAIKKINDVVSEIVSGHLSPDTDHANEWGQRFGFNMMAGRNQQTIQ